MNRKDSKAVTLTLPTALLAHIDRLAKQDYATRSDILRQAALQYVRRSGIDRLETAEAKSAIPKMTIEEKPRSGRKLKSGLSKEYINPADWQLRQLLDDYEQGKP